MRAVEPGKESCSRGARMRYTSQGVPHAFFVDDYGCGDISHVRRAESHVHWDGGSRGSSHRFSYADDVGRWFRRCKVQVVHEHVGRDGDGLVHQPSKCPRDLVRTTVAVVQGAVYCESRSPTQFLRSL